MLNKTLNQPSRMMTARMKSCDVVLSAIETDGPQMIGLLGEKYSSHLEEGQVMPFETQLQLFEKELIRLRDELREAERRNRDQKARETKARGRRDADVKRVNAKVGRVRKVLTGVYDDQQAAEIGLARRNARDPEVLLEQAATLAVHLGRSELELAEAQLGGIDVDAPQLAQDVKPSADRLRRSLSGLRREVKRTEATQIAKDEAMAEFNHGFLWIARSIESQLRLAGLEEQAARVRPSSRRPGVTERLESGAEGDEPEADDELEASGDQPRADSDSSATGSEDSSAETTVTQSEAS